MRKLAPVTIAENLVARSLKLGVRLALILAASFYLLTPTPATAAPTNTVDPIWYFGDYTSRALNVKRVTITPLGSSGDYQGTNLSRMPLIYSAAAHPSLTNGLLQVTNLIPGYAYKVAFSDGYSEPAMTNYFGTNLFGTVGAVTNQVTHIEWRNGAATQLYGPYFGATNVTYYINTNSTGGASVNAAGQATATTNSGVVTVTVQNLVTNLGGLQTNQTIRASGSAGTKAVSVRDILNVEQLYIDDEGVTLPQLALDSPLADGGFVWANGDELLRKSWNGLFITNIQPAALTGTLTNNTTGNAATATRAGVFLTNVVFASQYGSDSDGTKNHFDKPFATLSTASLFATNGANIILQAGNLTNLNQFELQNGISISGMGRGNTFLNMSDVADPNAMFFFGNNTVENLTLTLGQDGESVAWLQVNTDNVTNINFINCTITNTTDLLWPSSYGSQWNFDNCYIFARFDAFLALDNIDTNSALRISNTRFVFDRRGRTYSPGSPENPWQCYGTTIFENSSFTWLSATTNSPYGFEYLMNPGKLLMVRNCFFDFEYITNSGATFKTPIQLAHMAGTNGATVIMENVSWREPGGKLYTFSTTTNLSNTLIHRTSIGAGSWAVPVTSTNLHFSTTNLALTIPVTGVYEITASFNAQTTISGGDTLTAKLRKTSGTPADLPSTTTVWTTTGALTGETIAQPTSLPTSIYAATGGDVIAIYAACPNLEFTVTAARITAVRLP